MCFSETLYGLRVIFLEWFITAAFCALTGHMEERSCNSLIHVHIGRLEEGPVGI